MDFSKDGGGNPDVETLMLVRMFDSSGMHPDTACMVHPRKNNMSPKKGLFQQDISIFKAFIFRVHGFPRSILPTSG